MVGKLISSSRRSDIGDVAHLDAEKIEREEGVLTDQGNQLNRRFHRTPPSRKQWSKENQEHVEILSGKDSQARAQFNNLKSPKDNNKLVVVSTTKLNLQIQVYVSIIQRKYQFKVSGQEWNKKSRIPVSPGLKTFTG